MGLYIQLTGELLDSTGALIAKGYSGLGAAKNDPAAQSIPNQGPIPVGFYTMLEPRDTPKHGPYAIPLVPDSANEMFGRSAFLIHGDSLEHPGAASDGCIIVPRPAREQAWMSGDHRLQVISGIETPSDLDEGDL